MHICLKSSGGWKHTQLGYLVKADSLTPQNQFSKMETQLEWPKSLPQGDELSFGNDQIEEQKDALLSSKQIEKWQQMQSPSKNKVLSHLNPIEILKIKQKRKMKNVALQNLIVGRQ